MFAVMFVVAIVSIAFTWVFISGIKKKFFGDYNRNVNLFKEAQCAMKGVTSKREGFGDTARRTRKLFQKAVQQVNNPSTVKK